jgi:hypothetical protein
MHSTIGHIWGIIHTSINFRVLKEAILWFSLNNSKFCLYFIRKIAQFHNRKNKYMASYHTLSTRNPILYTEIRFALITRNWTIREHVPRIFRTFTWTSPIGAICIGIWTYSCIVRIEMDNSQIRVSDIPWINRRILLATESRSQMVKISLSVATCIQFCGSQQISTQELRWHIPRNNDY